LKKLELILKKCNLSQKYGDLLSELLPKLTKLEDFAIYLFKNIEFIDWEV